jgi:hypothetical protein
MNEHYFNFINSNFGPHDNDEELTPEELAAEIAAGQELFERERAEEWNRQAWLKAPCEIEE